MPLPKLKKKTNPNMGRALKTASNTGSDIASYVIYLSSLVEPFSGLIAAAAAQTAKIANAYSGVKLEVGKFTREVGVTAFGTATVDTRAEYDNLMASTRLSPIGNDIIVLDPARVPARSLLKVSDSGGTTLDPAATPAIPINAELFLPSPPGSIDPIDPTPRPAYQFGKPYPSDANAIPPQKVDNTVGAWKYTKGNPWKGMDGKGASDAGRNTDLTIPTITVKLGKHNIDYYLDKNGKLDPVLASAIGKAEKEVRESYGTYNQPPVYLGTVNDPKTGQTRVAQVKHAPAFGKKHYKGPVLVRFEAAYTDPDFTTTGTPEPNQRAAQEMIDMFRADPDLIRQLSPLRYNAVLLKNKGRKPDDKEVKAKVQADYPTLTVDTDILVEACRIRDENGEETHAFRKWASQKLTSLYNTALGEANHRHDNSLAKTAEYLAAGVCLGTAAPAVAGFSYVIANYIAAMTGGISTILPGIDVQAIKDVYGPEFRTPGLLLLTSIVAGTNWAQLRKMRTDFDFSKTEGMGNTYCCLELR